MNSTQNKIINNNFPDNLYFQLSILSQKKHSKTFKKKYISFVRIILEIFKLSQNTTLQKKTRIIGSKSVPSPNLALQTLFLAL